MAKIPKNDEIVMNVRFPISLWDAIKMRIAGEKVVRAFLENVLKDFGEDSGVEQSGSS